MALTFVSKTILNGNQNESQKAHQILVNFLCSGSRDPTEFDVRLLRQVLDNLTYFFFQKKNSFSFIQICQFYGTGIAKKF